MKVADAGEGTIARLAACIVDPENNKSLAGAGACFTAWPG